MSAAPAGPQVEEDRVVLRVPDPDRRLARVRLHQEVERPRDGPDFAWREAEAAWVLEFPRRGLDRLEYTVERHRHDGTTERGVDPANPLSVPAPFGARSVVEFPGYVPPAWLDDGRPPAGTSTTHDLRSRLLRTSVPAVVWSAPGHDAAEPLPLLVVHDGPDYAAYARLPLLLERRVADGTLPPHRAALLSPVDRDEHYGASPLYARALTEELLPALNQVAPTVHERHGWVGMGASLGALAMLTAHRLHPGTFGGLFLQSGSYFHLYADRHEGGFRPFRRIRAFVDDVLRGGGVRDPVPVTMTVGTVEENRHSNRAVHDALAAQGYPVRLHEVRDAHTWTAWRDALDPHLVDLLRRLWTTERPTPDAA